MCILQSKKTYSIICAKLVTKKVFKGRKIAAHSVIESSIDNERKLCLLLAFYIRSFIVVH